LDAIVRMAGAAPSFKDALTGSRLAVIAELKRRSPSKGTLDDSLSATARTQAYVAAGASALSILTEPARFGGSLSDLREARGAVAVPLLRKDFITDDVQLLEARAFGASAALLIARALAPTRLAELAAAAIDVGLTPLIEIRSEEELADALTVREAVIGVNNRDLETLVIEPEVGARLIPLVPADRVAVYESGVSSRADGERAAALGADAVLVGSALSTASDPSVLLGDLTSLARRRRG
jgi:indole-3-glycerol phosphate synthase